ncbi:hypothetical protein NIES2111_65080 (plasmid) [Nostoc sp. NIES-2111]|nr:hypothetical protein NIES2111_65080 [Nostoc sp. NIES-2111]
MLCICWTATFTLSMSVLKIVVMTRQEAEGRREELFGQFDFSLHILVFYPVLLNLTNELRIINILIGL